MCTYHAQPCADPDCGRCRPPAWKRCCDKCRGTRFGRSMRAAIDSVALTDAQRVFMHKRYLKLVDAYIAKYAYIRVLHIFSKTFITVATVLIPTLLSITQDAASSATVGSTLQWLVLGLSMAVTIVNGLAELFGVSTMYAKYWLTIEPMQSEGWQFVQGTGRYARYPNPAAGFPKFAATLEKMQHLTVRQLSQLDKRGDKSESKAAESGGPPTLRRTEESGTSRISGASGASTSGASSVGAARRIGSREAGDMRAPNPNVNSGSEFLGSMRQLLHTTTTAPSSSSPEEEKKEEQLTDGSFHV